MEHTFRFDSAGQEELRANYFEAFAEKKIKKICGDYWGIFVLLFEDSLIDVKEDEAIKNAFIEIWMEDAQKAVQKYRNKL